MTQGNGKSMKLAEQNLLRRAQGAPISNSERERLIVCEAEPNSLRRCRYIEAPGDRASGTRDSARSEMSENRGRARRSALKATRPRASRIQSHPCGEASRPFRWEFT